MESALVQAALACGAYKAEIIPQDAIRLDESFRASCRQNSCGRYGRCWMCPPDIGEIRALMIAVGRWPKAMLYQTIGVLEDSYDVEGMAGAASAHAQVSQKIQERAKALMGDRFLHLTCGGCHLCPACAKGEGLPCRHPDRALPSLEGYGVDVYRTSQATHLKYINGTNTVTYFGMVLFGA